MRKTSSSAEATKAARHQTVALKANLTTMTVGLGLGDQWGQLCWLDADGEVADEGRVKMTRTALTARFGGVAPLRVALETGTHSLWVSELLRALGHELIVANARGTGHDRAQRPQDRPPGCRETGPLRAR